MRHSAGEKINVTDGKGNLHLCEILPQERSAGKSGKREKGPDALLCRIISTTPGFGMHNYSLCMAVAPTKNIERFEWFVEKSTEMGIDTIVPIICHSSERRSLNTERLEKILLSAAKQSLKGALPAIQEPTDVKKFIEECAECNALKLVAYCGEATKSSIAESIAAYKTRLGEGERASIIILIGPEGDFTPEEIGLALEKGFLPIHLGESRLRTETAAVVATAAVYLNFL